MINNLFYFVTVNNHKKANKSLVEKLVQEKNKNNLEKNLNILKKISRPVVKFETIRSAVLDKRTLDSLDKKEVNTNADESFFTEQEFKEFEKTYFNKK